MSWKRSWVTAITVVRPCCDHVTLVAWENVFQSQWKSTRASGRGAIYKCPAFTRTTTIIWLKGQMMMRSDQPGFIRDIIIYILLASEGASGGGVIDPHFFCKNLRLFSGFGAKLSHWLPLIYRTTNPWHALMRLPSRGLPFTGGGGGCYVPLVKTLT